MTGMALEGRANDVESCATGLRPAIDGLCTCVMRLRALRMLSSDGGPPKPSRSTGSSPPPPPPPPLGLLPGLPLLKPAALMILDAGDTLPTWERLDAEEEEKVDGERGPGGGGGGGARLVMAPLCEDIRSVECAETLLQMDSARRTGTGAGMAGGGGGGGALCDKLALPLLPERMLRAGLR